MKTKHIFLSAIFSLCALSLMAQIPTGKTGWSQKTITSNLGVHGDHFFNMNLNFLEGRISDANYSRMDLNGLEEQDYVMNTTGANINLGLQLSRIDNPKGISKYESIEFDLGLHFGREVMVDYTNANPAAFCQINNLDECYSTITFCDLQNEINLTGIYRRGISFFNMMNIYTGVGTTIGATMASQMWIFGTKYNYSNPENYEYTTISNESFNLNESVVGRVFIPVGGEIVLLDKLHLSAEGRLGVGYNHSFGQGGFGNVNYSVLAGIGWTI